ncbi:MAG: hypothetical protein JSU74_11980 [Candidatus Zixiibacteriota bacterium]|nr:MAG: hypothetical protein JSU74_11980 [candidate division Zixibacteria bacterium]
MRKITIYIFALLFLFSVSSPVLAVDKKDKKDTTDKVVDKKVDQPKDQTQQPQPPKQTEPPKKKYDDFQDKNNNGIDDRKENLKQKKTEGDPREKKTKP